jgi:hypothetical protein
MCRPRCTPGGFECANFGAACAFEACLASCSVAPASGEPACPSVAPCDPYSGRCAAARDGRLDGEPCDIDADCKSGSCFREVGLDGTPTGALDGMCISYARAVATVMGEPVPASNCPAGAGAPGLGVQPGDLTVCYPICDDDSQCRLGYHCDRFEDPSSGVPYFTNGVCLPIDCARAGADACPGGTTCASDGVRGVCARSSADGGIDANDASLDAGDVANDARDDASTDLDADAND